MHPMNRRAFLQMSAAAVAVGLVIPAFAAGREPYVFEGEVVDHIGFVGGFIGGAKILQVLPWDGVGFPCVLLNQANHPVGQPMLDRHYDSDLCNFRREVEDGWWLQQHSTRSYPNVHAWVRERRYGEDPKTFWQRRDAAREARAAS